MLEVKDLVKVYKTKGGAEVRALDGITLSFEEKGMVFLLGRSGSGKSTLLNVCGGLDSPDSGEIIVDGVSFESFKAKDYDEYRNKYIGFIFQEYNLIDNFNVEQNISLALELQKEKNKNELVEKSLEQVRLQGYGKRHINELSGGQKQRVAIARALVKNPSMIFADEPTGNLDSITAGEVFDILKKLSEERLIVVVSHDRESAERYGDRIVELQDGAIISDTVVKDTSKEGTVEEKEVRKQKRAGNMPFGRAFTYAMSNLWHKKIRVTVSILLFIITLGLFNYAYATSMFDIYKMTQKTFNETDPEIVYLNTYNETEKYNYVEEVFKEEAFPIYRDRNFDVKISSVYKKESYYYKDDIFYSMQINEDILKNFNLELVCGRLPQKAEEICISKYKAESILYVWKSYFNSFGITKIEQLIGIENNLFNFEIVGIIDTKFPEMFDELKEMPSSDYAYDKNYGLAVKFEDETDRKLHDVMFCHESYYEYNYLPRSFYFEYSTMLSSVTIEGRSEKYLQKNGIEYKSIDYAEGGIILGERLVTELLRGQGYIDYNEDVNLLDIIKNNEIMIDLTYDSDYYFYERLIGYSEIGTPLSLSGKALDRFYEEVGCVEALAIDTQNTEALYRAIELSNLNNEDSTLYFNSISINEIEHGRQYAELEKQICGIACPIFAIIVILLLLNYFMSTIKDKNGEIGILRAIGVKNSNIIGIFLLEAVIICLIAYIISLPITFAVANKLEIDTMNSMPEGYDVFVHYINVGFESCLVTFIMALGVAFIGCITPFIKLGRMKPMEIIRQK